MLICGQKNGPCQSTAQVLGGNAHKGDATTECQGRYPVVAMQNMMLRMRNVKIHPMRFVKRFLQTSPVSYWP
jgi:hypothetical protein